MKKVVVKCKLKNKEEFEQKLADIELNFSAVYWQHDRVFVPRNYKRGMNLPRMIMRTEMKAVDKPARYELILKRHIEDSDVEIEHRTVVKDYAEAANIVHQLGFEQKIEVSKRRQGLEMGEGVMIYLDKVDNVPGYFAKIEVILGEKDSVAEAADDLHRTLMVLGQKDWVEEAYFEQIGQN